MRGSFKIPCFMLFCLGVLRLCVSSTCTLVTSPQVTSTGLVPPHWSGITSAIICLFWEIHCLSRVGHFIQWWWPTWCLGLGGVAEDDIWWWGDLSQLDIFDHQLSHWQCVCVCAWLVCSSTMKRTPHLQSILQERVQAKVTRAVCCARLLLCSHLDGAHIYRSFLQPRHLSLWDLPEACKMTAPRCTNTLLCLKSGVSDNWEKSA